MDKEKMGLNRTGIQMSPIDSKAMQELAPTVPEMDGEQALSELRSPYIADADGLGSVPLPATFKGVVSGGMTMLKGESPQLLLDKLGERLAFERTGTRLYDALICKCEVLLDDTISMRLEDLRQIRNDEHGHMLLVAEAIQELGGDPTAQTPCADLVGVESAGLLHVVADPRTSIGQCLHAILTAELADRAGWESLIALADVQGLDDLVNRFSQALETEREHLGMVETWYNESLGLSYGDVELGGSALTGERARPL
ncbi:MAG TPA: ferritin-like domain-containing protein [Telluria sp.]|nr:ferritin-like domain-containing protein [Telluria sp.]